jgi:Uma2 family endonuclease
LFQFIRDCRKRAARQKLSRIFADDEGGNRKSGVVFVSRFGEVCGAPEFYDENEDVLLNPTVIFEVLSPATECFDRVEKFLHYTNYIESLRDYVLISQDQPMIEHYAKQSNKVWHKAETEGFDAVFFLPTTQFKISLAELYDLVEFF